MKKFWVTISAPHGSADRKGTNIAPEDPGRVVFEEGIGQQGACKADKEECIENIPLQECLEKERKEKDEREPGSKPVEPRVHVEEVRNDRNVGWYDELDIDNGEVHLTNKRKRYCCCGNEGDQRVCTIIKEDQFRRPAYIDHIVKHAEDRKERHDIG